MKRGEKIKKKREKLKSKKIIDNLVLRILKASLFLLAFLGVSLVIIDILEKKEKSEKGLETIPLNKLLSEGDSLSTQSLKEATESKGLRIIGELGVLKSDGDINLEPKGDTITIFADESKIFSVGNRSFDSIEWYLNNKLVNIDSNVYEAKNLAIGDYEVKVEVKKGDESFSKSWNFFIIGDEEAKERVFDTKKVIFFTIIIVLLLIIIMIVLLVLQERNRKVKVKPAVRLEVLRLREEHMKLGS